MSKRGAERAESGRRRLLSRWNGAPIWQQLASIALVFAVPLVLTTWLLIEEKAREIDFASHELAGVRYARPLLALLPDVSAHRALAHDALSGRQDVQPQVARAEEAVEADLAQLRAVDAKFAKELATTSGDLASADLTTASPAAMTSAWGKARLITDATASDRAHDVLLDDVAALLSHIGDTSNLILDPDLDSYYLMDAFLLQSPTIVLRYSDLLRDLTARAAATRASDIAGQVALLRQAVSAMRSDIERAVAQPRARSRPLRGALTAPLAAAEAADKEALALASATTHSSAAAYTAVIRTAVDAHQTLWSSLLDQEDRLLRDRRSGSEGRQTGDLTRVLVITVLAALLTWYVARRITKNVSEVATAAAAVAGGDLGRRARVTSRDEIGATGRAFNDMVDNLAQLITQTKQASAQVATSATELSAGSEELAATTTEQSAAVTEASATMEELARTSVAIAETVDRVAKQAAETRENLEQAERDIETSSERTLALANRVNDVEVLLGLINEIADQTNLLALNAAIEAARAGESGRGFTVVADEVRRLAERSKSSAADIAGIIQNTQAETNATVMAMEKGAKQMQRGLVLLDEVAVATDQVRLTTQQQRSATEQVVESMQQLSDASRQISTTAEQLAHAAADLAGLSATLERSSATDTVG